MTRAWGQKKRGRIAFSHETLQRYVPQTRLRLLTCFVYLGSSLCGVVFILFCCSVGLHYGTTLAVDGLFTICWTSFRSVKRKKRKEEKSPALLSLSRARGVRCEDKLLYVRFLRTSLASSVSPCVAARSFGSCVKPVLDRVPRVWVACRRAKCCGPVDS